MVRLSLPRFRIMPPKRVPQEPVWPPPPPPGSREHVPFPELPHAATQATSFSSSSPLNPISAPNNANAVVSVNEGEDPASVTHMPTRSAVLAKRRSNGAFLDYLHISMRAGTGGNGAIAFTKLFHRRDGRGQPSGAAGGAGGDIYLQASYDVQSLADIHRVIKGNPGTSGKGDALTGTKGADIVIKVPPGTRVRQISREVYRPLNEEEILLDPIERDPLLISRLLLTHPNAKADQLNDPPMTPAQKYNTTIHGTPQPPPPPIDVDLTDMIDQKVLMVRGGNGGEGNISFGRNDEDRNHLYARKGEVPDLVKLELELRLLADVGFLGAPNAGKSTLLQALTGAEPRIASHAFTTLNPQVGVCRIVDSGTILSSPNAPSPLTTPESDIYFSHPVEPTPNIPGDQPLPDRIRHHKRRSRVSAEDESLRFSICDNPGLVKDSHLNKGLGHQFLLSVTRSPTLVLVLDFSLPLGKLIEQADMLIREVEMFEPEQALKDRIRLVIGNKADLVSDPVKGMKRKEGLARWIRATLGPRRVMSPLTGERELVGEEVELKLISGKWGQGIRDLAYTMGELVVKTRQIEREEREERQRKEREEEEEMIRGLQVVKRVLRIDQPKPEPTFGLRKGVTVGDAVE